MHADSFKKVSIKGGMSNRDGLKLIILRSRELFLTLLNPKPEYLRQPVN